MMITAGTQKAIATNETFFLKILNMEVAEVFYQ